MSTRISRATVPHRPRVTDVPTPQTLVHKKLLEAFEQHRAGKRPVVTPPPLPQLSVPPSTASISLRHGVNPAATVQASFESTRRPAFLRSVVDVDTPAVPGSPQAQAARAVANAAPTDLRSLLAEKNELLTAWQDAQAKKTDRFQLLDSPVLASLMERFRDFDKRAKALLEGGTGLPPEMDEMVQRMFAQLEPMKAMAYDAQNVLNHIYQKKEGSAAMSLAQSATLNEIAAVPFYEAQRLSREPAPAGDFLDVARRFYDLVSPGLRRANDFVDAAARRHD